MFEYGGKANAPFSFRLISPLNVVMLCSIRISDGHPHEHDVDGREEGYV